MTIQIKVTEQYFPEMLFIMLYKVVRTFESVQEIQAINQLYPMGLFAERFVYKSGK